MYRLCRLFISDVKAGGNFLRNGSIPILRESGSADHGVLFAANGTCKTTLLSFILGVFCPDQRRFVQHLQSGGDKTLEQYLVPGRPAVILLDLAANRQPTFFGDPREHLIIGQLLYRHRAAAEKIERTYFIAQKSDFIDTLAREWDGLLAQGQPYRAVRDFMSPRIQQTTSQKEWSDILERLGLDPWLIDRQVDFARTEGGIKNTFKFRSEADFVSFFLGCVADIDAAATLRESIDRSLQKMAGRPGKIEQFHAARSLKEKIADFDSIAKQWRRDRDSLAETHARLGEACHLLQVADKTAAGERDARSQALTEAQEERDKAYYRRQTAVVNEIAVRREQLERDFATAEAKIDRAKQNIVQFEEEKNGIKAAGLLAQTRKLREEIAIKQDALLAAGDELAPLVLKVDSLAAQYHVRLDHDRREIKNALDEIRDCIKQREESKNRLNEQLYLAGKEQNRLGKRMAHLSSRMQAAEEGRTALPLEPGESVLNAGDRLRVGIEAFQEREAGVGEQIAGLNKEKTDVDQQWRRLQEKRSDLAGDLKQASNEVQAEARARQRLLSDPHLKRVAGTSDFEPISADLITRFDNAIARNGDKLAAKKQRLLTIENELARLERTTTLAADDQTQRLIAHYHQAGVSGGELKSFPEYLADLYESPDEIAVFVDRDPGRFTGIMAATEEVIDKVRALPVPDWLRRPVVISRPCPPEEVTPIAATVIRPADSRVYSKRYLTETKADLRAQVDTLKGEIDQQTSVFREMERSGNGLHIYQERYPDRAAVEAPTERVRELEADRLALTEKIGTTEARAQELQQRRSELEGLSRNLAGDLAQHREWLKQVEKWGQNYADLDAWRQERQDLVATLAELGKAVDRDSKNVRELRREIEQLQRSVLERDYQLRSLDDWAKDVPGPARDFAITEDVRRMALAMDQRTLRGLYEKAGEEQRRKANALGVEGLQREVKELSQVLGEQETESQVFRRGHAYDDAFAESWAGRAVAERKEREEFLAAAIKENNAVEIRATAENESRRRDITRLAGELSEKSTKGFPPDVTEEELATQDLGGVLLRLQAEKTRHGEEYARLKDRCDMLRQKMQDIEAWRQELELAMAEARRFEPVWDEHSPRAQWEDVSLAPGQERLAAAQAFRARLQEMLDAEVERQKASKISRDNIGAAFERLQTELRSDAFKHHLPAVVDELREHDAETLAEQGADLTQRCEDVARNIESELEITQKIVDNLVDMLLQRGREYHQKLQAAARETLPEEVFIYGGKPILRAGTRLDFAKHGDVFRRSVENWLHELIQEDRLPEANPATGNRLGAELLYQLLRAASGKKEFGIRLLKCDDTGRNYEPVDKDMGSGGEALTTAVLLYTLLISMRQKRRGHAEKRIPAFLVLDNPLGVCNKADFIDAQLKVAGAMGIQCVYLTGINDRESLDLFELRVAIRKGLKKIKIDGSEYDSLEITELNVEKRHGP